MITGIDRPSSGEVWVNHASVLKVSNLLSIPITSVLTFGSGSAIMGSPMAPVFTEWCGRLVDWHPHHRDISLRAAGSQSFQSHG